MTAALPQLVNRARRSLTLSLSAKFTAIFLLGACAIGLFVFIRTAQLVDNTISNYGNTVSTQLAQAALDSAIRRDMIALQAHLARMMKTRGIVSAAVYDVQNELLAQSGSTPTELHGREHLHTFPTVLTLGDNIVGRVVVTIDTSDIEHLREEMYWVIGSSFAVTFLLICLLSHRIARQLNQQQIDLVQPLLNITPTNILPEKFIQEIQAGNLQPENTQSLVDAVNTHIEQLGRPSPAVLLNAAIAITNPTHGCAYLLLECRNFDLLQRQISRERLRSLLNQFQEKMENTCRLYGGQRISTQGPFVKILFSSSENQESTLAKQAFCCAYLLSNLLMACKDESLGVRLSWSIALDWHKPCGNDLLRNIQLGQDEQRARWLCQQVGGDQIAVSEIIAVFLDGQTQLRLAENSGSGGQRFYRLAGIAEDLATLLERQAMQLNELWSRQP
ncbi:MAG TPA: hypothetical protein PLF22_05790 [Pseudomonadales bacterium]|nr:hypothetical protein [Pseudomonadales bacterium]